MLKRIKYINETTKHVLIMSESSNESWAVLNGFSAEMHDVEQGYDEQWYLAGYAPVAPEPTTDELATKLRAERDARITSCDWIMARHAEEVTMGLDTTLDESQYSEWLSYRQELRDLTDDEGFPWDGGGEETPWPVAPEM